MLHALGFIEKRPSRGVVVKAALGPNQPQSISDSEVLTALPTAVEVREIVEIRCVELAIQTCTNEDVHRLRESLVTFEEALGKGDVFSAVQAHLAFHDAIVMLAHNKFLSAMYQQVRFMIADIGATRAQELFLEKEHFAAHWNIYTVIKDRNLDAVRSAIKDHNRIAGPLRQVIIENAIAKSETPSQ